MSEQDPNVTTGFRWETVPQVPVDPDISAFESGRVGEAIRPTFSEKWIERVKQVSEESAIGFLPGYEGEWLRSAAEQQYAKELEQAGKTKISAEEANKRFPGMPKAFDEDVYPEIAQLRYDEHQRRLKTNAWMARGPEMGFFSEFAAGATSALDPVNLGLGVLGGLGLAGLGLKQTLPVVFGENLLGNLAADIPTYYLRERRQQEVDLEGTLLGSVAGATLGTGITYGIRGLGKVFSKDAPEIRQANQKQAIAQHEAGKRIDLTESYKLREARLSGQTNVTTGVQPYVFSPIDRLEGRVFYAGDNNGSSVELDTRLEGVGLSATDNNYVINNLVATPESQIKGVLKEFQLDPNAKILDLDRKVDSPESKKIFDDLKSKFEGKLDLSQADSLNQVLDILDNAVDTGRVGMEAKTDFVDTIKQNGFDGIRYVESNGGEALDNRVNVFNKDKLLEVKDVEANPDIVPRPNDEVSRNIEARNMDEAYSKYSEADAALENVKRNPPPREMKFSEEDAYLKERYQQSEAYLKEKAKQDPELAAQLQDLSANHALDKQKSSMLRSMAECFWKGMR